MLFFFSQIFFGPYILPEIDWERFDDDEIMIEQMGTREKGSGLLFSFSRDKSPLAPLYQGWDRTENDLSRLIEKDTDDDMDLGPAPSGTVATWFFDTKVDGFSHNRAWGHCTQYAAWYWWKHFELEIPWRGNAGQRIEHAQSYDRPTGDTSELGAFVVFDRGTEKRSAYGHVGVVVKLDQDHRMMMIEDMNYKGTNVASHHWISMDDTSIVGYIYVQE